MLYKRRRQLLKKQGKIVERDRVYCRDCGKYKFLFETERKALNYIKYNSEDIYNKGGYSPNRAYFCIVCGGYHVTHKIEKPNDKSLSEKIMEAEARNMNHKKHKRNKE